MGTSKIEWTDATWNPVRGCTKVSPGCAHCYAETFAERWRGVPGHPYERGFDLRLVPGKLAEPLTWKNPRRVFVNSMSDLFHESVPDEYIAAVFGVMAATPRHTYQVLTKRSKRMREWFEWIEQREHWKGGVAHPCVIAAGTAMKRDAFSCEPVPWPLPNVWLGCSTEDQWYADKRILNLRATPAAVRFLSCEPLLGEVDLRRALTYGHDPETSGAPHLARMRGIDWVIVGGESGPRARPMDVQWARSIVEQCKAARVPVFVKQLGAKPVTDIHNCIGRVYLRSYKGKDMDEWPEALRVREFPEVTP